MTATTKTEPEVGKGTHCAFFYGTLVFFSVCYNNKTVPEEIAARHTFTPAILHGYCRRRVKAAPYPGITPDEKHQVFGTFATGLSDSNMDLLDSYEGDEYVREQVKVKLLTQVGDAKGEGNVEGEERTAEVYVFIHPQDLEDREWDLEEFRQDQLHMFTRDGHVFDDVERPHVESGHPYGIW